MISIKIIVYNCLAMNENAEYKKLQYELYFLIFSTL